MNIVARIGVKSIKLDFKEGNLTTTTNLSMEEVDFLIKALSSAKHKINFAADRSFLIENLRQQLRDQHGSIGTPGNKGYEVRSIGAVHLEPMGNQECAKALVWLDGQKFTGDLNIDRIRLGGHIQLIPENSEIRIS